MSEIFSKLMSRMLGKRTSKITARKKTEPLLEQKPVALSVVPGKRDRLLNREITDLQFIERVMEEAGNTRNPLLERVRFLAIAADVLDQFYAVRVAKLRRSVSKRDGYVTPDGLSPNQQLTLVMGRANDIMQAQQELFTSLREELLEQDIQLCELDSLTDDDKVWLNYYFEVHFLHVLTPMTVDEEHPLPFIPSGGLCVVLEFADGFILVPLPANLPRFVALPGGGNRFVSAETIINLCWHSIVQQDSLEGIGIFQILRDNDLAREERNDDLRAIVESGLRLRDRANVIRLNVSSDMSEDATRYVAQQLGLLSRKEIAVMENRGMRLADSPFVASSVFVGLSSFSDVLTIGGSKPGLLFPAYKARWPEAFKQHDNDYFAAISKGDVLLHWPFESFDTVVEFIRQAADDPQVTAIKQTFYRTDDESAIVEALIHAAGQGKTVLAVIELEARDNESSNVTLAKRMEMAGVQIVYGIIGLKIHWKATHVVRTEGDQAITYTHFSTGNYHPRNAKTYTDLSFFTKDQVIGRDTHLIFNYLTSARVQKTERLLVAPHFLRTRLIEMIERERDNASNGQAAYICMKVNALIDPEIIEKLYEASEAGVDIDLIVRRQCRLRPGVPGMSSRITVKSVVGRFLEHSRIFLFANGKPLSASTAELFFGSPDIMERNLDKRVEVLVPVLDEGVKQQIIDGIMHAYVRDGTQSWILAQNGEYERLEIEDAFDAQQFFMEEKDVTSLGSFPHDGLATQRHHA